jgi:hypothetical protein
MLHEAYRTSRAAWASDENTREDDAILSALASELGYQTAARDGTL